jgi:protocatechuate 3,4-dioxygenase beta subunit
MQSIVAPSAPGRTIELGKDEVREIQVALPRAYAIDVRVLDSDGDTLSEVGVAVRRADGAGSFASAPGQRATDDRGWLRVFGLAAGRYTVCAEDERAGAARVTGIDAPRAAAAHVLSIGSQRRAGGRHHRRSRGRRRAGDPDGRGRTYTVAGRIVDASGAPAAGVMAQFSQFERSASSGIGLIVDADGRFRIANVHPGGTRSRSRSAAATGPSSAVPFEAGFLPVQVSDADVEDLLVTMKKAWTYRAAWCLTMRHSRSRSRAVPDS